MKEIVFGEKLEGVDYFKRPGVYGIALNEHGEVAIVKTPTGYFLPGGGIEGNESYPECLQREFLEETGYEIQIEKFIGEARQYYYSEELERHVYSIGYFYEVILKNKTMDSIEDDHELQWFEPEKCTKLLLLQNQSWAVLELLKRKRSVP